jgi:hypothetical protein
MKTATKFAAATELPPGSFTSLCLMAPVLKLSWNLAPQFAKTLLQELYRRKRSVS